MLNDKSHKSKFGVHFKLFVVTLYLSLFLPTTVGDNSIAKDLIFKFTSKYPLLYLFDTDALIKSSMRHANASLVQIDSKMINKTLVDAYFLSHDKKKINIQRASRLLQRQIDEVNIYLTTIICFAGIIGNLLSLKVFCSTKLRRTSSITYLIALTITDSLFLMVHFLDNTCREIVTHFRIDFPLNIIDQKVTICRTFSLIRSACRCASPWIIVAFTMERFVVVNYPIHANIISRPLLAKRLVLVIFILSVLISLYSPALSGIVYYAKKNSLSSKLYKAYKNTYKMSIFKNMHFEEMFFEKSCDILASYRSFYIYLTLIYTVIVVVIPLIVVSIFNALLITRLYKAADQWTSAKLKLHEQEMSYKELRDKKVQIENWKITWTLIIISVSFILLTLPHTVLYFIWTIPKIAKENLSHKFFLFNISPNVMKFTELLYVLNHSINFFLYTITRNSFRKVLKEQFQVDWFRNLHLDYSHGKGNAYLLKNTKIRQTKYRVRKTNLKQEDNKELIKLQNVTNQMTTKSSKPEGLDYENYWEIMTVSEPLVTATSIKCALKENDKKSKINAHKK